MVHLSRQRRLRHRDEHGVLAVVVAASAVMIFVLAALVVDLGLARDTRRQAQNAADAAALAAGNALYTVGKTPRFTESVAAAEQYAADNLGVDPDPATRSAWWSSCTDPDVPLGWYRRTPCISYDSAVLPKEVRVVVPTRTVDTPMASVIGSDNVQVSAAAQMRLEPDAKAKCAFCVLGAGPHNVQNGGITVNGGDVHFNGSVSVSSNGAVTAAGGHRITVEGTASGAGTYSPMPLNGQPQIRDPLEFLSPPDYSMLSPRSSPCLGPGIFGDFSAGCASPLTPGLYVVTGRWKFSGSSTKLIGPGVTLYFACGTSTAPRACNSGGEQGGYLEASGGAQVQITAPSSGPTQGMAIWYARNNIRDLSIQGDTAALYTGTIYAPSAKLLLGGSGSSTLNDTLVVVRSVELNGNPTSVTSTYTGVSTVPMPPGDLHLSK